MDVDAHVAAVGEERRPRVQAHARTDGTGPERLGQLGGGGESGGRSCKRDEERVALRIDLHPVVTGTCLADDLPVRGKCAGIDLRPQLLQELRRPLDVGEEEGDSAGRKFLMHRRDHARRWIFRLGGPPKQDRCGGRRASERGRLDVRISFARLVG